jgi:hypothetical protein
MLPTTEKQNTAQNAENSHNWESVADTELWKFRNFFSTKKTFVKKIILSLTKKIKWQYFEFFSPQVYIWLIFAIFLNYFLPSFAY